MGTILTTFSNPPSGLAIFQLPVTDMGTVYRSAAAQAETPTVYIGSQEFQLTAANIGQVYDAQVAYNQSLSSTPLTDDDKARIGNALLAVLDNHALTIEDASKMVFIDGRFYTASRENLTRLLTLTFAWREKQNGKPLTDAEQQTIARGLANLIDGSNPVNANQTPSTLSIALAAVQSSFQEAHDIVLGTPADGGKGGILGTLDVLGYAALVWAIYKAIGPRGISGLLGKGK